MCYCQFDLFQHWLSKTQVFKDLYIFILKDPISALSKQDMQDTIINSKKKLPFDCRV